ncbi:unnamed protein product [Effrenium voratum]|nr:unnamed protein product [Effrenium voratum]
MFSIYMVHLSACLVSVSILVYSVLGLFHVWRDSTEDWPSRVEEFEHLQQQEELDITAGEVLHVVILPSFRTPLEVLENTLRSLAEFDMADRQLALCLAFEEREDDAQEKEKALRKVFQSQFAFITATYHPSQLPNHLPGKSSNECWAFQQLCKDLEAQGLQSCDPRVVITIMDDDSYMHPKYFEALTYYFLAAGPSCRYMRIWQPPICHFKNFLRQPVLVQISSLFSTLSELAGLANPLDCHVTYSTYSISLVLATAVGGWDPDFLAEDWHMFAKCAVKSEGRLRCVPIFLPVLNYTPEEDTYWQTLCSRWTQAKRHALGVSEVVYVLSASFLAFLELPSWRLVLGGRKLTRVARGSKGGCEGEKDGKVRRQN